MALRQRIPDAEEPACSAVPMQIGLKGSLMIRLAHPSKDTVRVPAILLPHEPAITQEGTR